MWWKICKGLSALVIVAAAFLIFIRVWPWNAGGDRCANPQPETPAPVLIEDMAASAEPAEHEDDQERPNSIAVQTPQAEQNQPDELTAYAGPIRYAQYAWEEVYRHLSQHPDAQREVSKNGSRTKVSNSEGERLYVDPGRIAYAFRSSASQLFELTSYPTQTASRDRELIQEGKTALSAEIDGLSREEAQQRMAALMDALLQSDRYHAKAVNIYGYTGAHLKRLHQLLYKKRADWSYFYKELPSEAEDGLYYIEMQLYIDDIPVCTENEALGIQYSVNSMYYIQSTIARLVLSNDRVIYLDVGYEFDLSGLEKINLLSEAQIQQMIEEDLKNNVLIRATDGMQKRLLYMYLQSGSGDQATYELRPAWCVRTSTKEEEDDQAFYDAASGELLF